MSSTAYPGCEAKVQPRLLLQRCFDVLTRSGFTAEQCTQTFLAIKSCPKECFQDALQDLHISGRSIVYILLLPTMLTRSNQRQLALSPVFGRRRQQ